MSKGKTKKQLAAQQYYLDNREKFLARSKAQYHADPGASKAKTNAYRKANPEKIKKARHANYNKKKDEPEFKLKKIRDNLKYRNNGKVDEGELQKLTERFLQNRVANSMCDLTVARQILNELRGTKKD